jgi:hypothetical protein
LRASPICVSYIVPPPPRTFLCCALALYRLYVAAMGEQWLRGPHMPRSISHEDIGEEAKVMDSDEPGLGLGGRAGWDFFSC